MSSSTIDGEIIQLPIEEIYIEKYKDNVQTKQVKENNMCLICRDETNTKISCNHDFHEECINKWIRESNNNLCPYCKKEIEIEKKINQDWENISEEQKLTEELIEKLQDKNFIEDNISLFQELSEESIKNFLDKVDWENAIRI